MLPFPSPQCAGGVPPGYLWNPSDKAAGVVLSNGNRTAAGPGGSSQSVRGTASKSAGKWYFEVTCDVVGTLAGVAIADATAGLGQFGLDTHAWSYRSSGDVTNNSAVVSSPSAYTSGDIIGVAMDLTALKLYFSKNNVWQASGNPVAGTGGLTISSAAYFPGVSLWPSQMTINTLVYSPPAGFGVL
jgi:hypothetical protein